MTPEAQRLAAELRRWADAIEGEFCGKTLPLRRIGDAGDCAAPVMREAANLLASLIPAGGLAGEARRMDWLESMANKPGGLLLHDGSERGRVGLGLRPGCLSRTLREAIDDAMAASTPPQEAK